MFDTNLYSSCVALQAPDGAAAFIEGGLSLRMGWHGPEAHTDPKSLHYLLNEWGACIWQSLGHQADWEVKSQGQWLQVLGQGRLDGQQGKKCDVWETQRGRGKKRDARQTKTDSGFFDKYTCLLCVSPSINHSIDRCVLTGVKKLGFETNKNLSWTVSAQIMH